MYLVEEVIVLEIPGPENLVVVPFGAYVDWIKWNLAPQPILNASGHKTDVVMLEDDLLELKESQPADAERYVLTKGLEKGADARALHFPDNTMFVLRGAKMARGHATKDMEIYNSKREELFELDGPVRQIGAELVFVLGHLFDDPSTAASVLAGYRVGGLDGWRKVTG
jgi:hypothetical protein